MRAIVLLVTIITLHTSLFGQIAIGTKEINPNAIFELASTKQGFLLPRLTQAQRDAMPDVPAGLVIYNTTSENLNFYNGSRWAAIDVYSNALNFSTNRHCISVSYGNGGAYAFYVDNRGVGVWAYQALSGGAVHSLSTKRQVCLYNATKAWTFTVNNKGEGSWSARALDAAMSSVSNDNLIVLYDTARAFGISQDSAGNEVWSSTVLTCGRNVSSLASKKQVVLYCPEYAYGFDRNSSGIATWRSECLSAIPISTQTTYDQIILTTGFDTHIFAEDLTNNATWYSRPTAGMSTTIVTRD